MGGSLRITTGNAARIVDAGCSELKCSHYCIGGGKIVGRSAGIAVKDAEQIDDA